jgi:hypothetical protein
LHNKDDGFKRLRMSIIQPKPTNPMLTPNVVSISDSDKATAEAERRYAAEYAELLSQYEAENAEHQRRYAAEYAELLSQYEAEDAERLRRHEDATRAAARATATVEEIDRGHLPHIQQQINNLDDINDDINDPNSNRTEIIFVTVPNRSFDLSPADKYHDGSGQPPNLLTPEPPGDNEIGSQPPADTPFGLLDFDAYNDD